MKKAGRLNVQPASFTLAFAISPSGRAGNYEILPAAAFPAGVAFTAFATTCTASVLTAAFAAACTAPVLAATFAALSAFARADLHMRRPASKSLASGR